MILGFLKENDKYETRAMLLPEHVKSITKIGFKLLVENNYAEKLNITDTLYADAGAETLTEGLADRGEDNFDNEVSSNNCSSFPNLSMYVHVIFIVRRSIH